MRISQIGANSNVANVGAIHGDENTVVGSMTTETKQEMSVPWWANIVTQAYQTIANGNPQDIDAALDAILITKNALERAKA